MARCHHPDGRRCSVHRFPHTGTPSVSISTAKREESPMRVSRSRLRRRSTPLVRAGGALAAASVAVLALPGLGQGVAGATVSSSTTPIDHVVVIFQENVSFDHYFCLLYTSDAAA